MDVVPNEVLEQFFWSLDIKSLASSACVCQRWYFVIESNSELWERHKRFVLERKGVLLLPSKSPTTGFAERQMIERLRTGGERNQTQLNKERPIKGSLSVREIMQGVSRANSTYAEDITIVIYGIMPQYRRAVIKALMREMRAADISIDHDSQSMHDFTVFHRGLLYHLHFRSLDNVAWLRAKEAPVYVCEHIFILAFSLDDRSEGITSASLRSIDRALSTLQRVTARHEIPLLLVGFKPTSFLDERERGEAAEGVSENSGVSERAPRSHFVCEEKEDLPFSKNSGVGEGGKEGRGEGERKEDAPVREEEKGLLSSGEYERDGEGEEDVEMGTMTPLQDHQVEDKGKEKESENGNESETKNESEKDGENEEKLRREDKMRKEAIQYMQYRMPRCDGYMEIGWCPSKMEVDEPLLFVTSLLEIQRRVKERAFSPEAYSISRNRLERRQLGGHTYLLLHILEGLLCVLLLPLPCVVTTAYTFLLGLYYVIWMLVLIVFPSLLAGHNNHNNIPYMLRPLIFLASLPPVLLWDAMVLVFLLLGCIFAPLVLWLLAFRYGYSYGLLGCVKIVAPLTIQWGRTFQNPNHTFISQVGRGQCNATTVGHFVTPYGMILFVAGVYLANRLLYPP